MQVFNGFSGEAENAARIIQDAGGQLKGRTRLQKVAYFLEITGLGDGFEFEYHRFGPYSEQLAEAISAAALLGMVSEEEYPTNWGGTYSIFTTERSSSNQPNALRVELLSQALASDPIALELAATAAFLAGEGEIDPWVETERRKPEKAKTRLEDAKALYSRLQSLPTPQGIPVIDEIDRVEEKHLAAGVSSHPALD